MMSSKENTVLRNTIFTGAFALSSLPFFVFAASNCSGDQLCNPTSFTGVAQFIAAFLKAIVVIALPIITLFIVYSGFLFVSARGNESGLTKAKENFKYVIIGSILILGAWVLATMIGATVTQVLGSS